MDVGNYSILYTIPTDDSPVVDDKIRPRLWQKIEIELIIFTDEAPDMMLCIVIQLVHT